MLNPHQPGCTYPFKFLSGVGIVFKLAAAVRRTLLEVSGDVTLDTIGEYAATGVDMISVGRITKSAPTLDLGLDLA